MNFEKLFPSILRESENFSVFVKLADKELSTIKDTITLMETLTNIDRTPTDFVRSIGEIIGFTYVDSYDEDIQRECIKSVWESRKEIGTHHALVMAATYGDIDGYLGGDLFIPGTAEISDRVEAIVVLPRDYLFKWSHSTWSGEDKFAGPIIYKEGTILIEVTKLDEKIQKRVEGVKPAGMQVIYKYVHDGKEEIITYLK